jgi:hypothetical protein
VLGLGREERESERASCGVLRWADDTAKLRVIRAGNWALFTGGGAREKAGGWASRRRQAIGPPRSRCAAGHATDRGLLH